MKLITANRLIDGEVVWFSNQNSWVNDLNKAKVIENAEELARALQMAEEAVADQQILEPYAVDVQRVNDRIEPISMKEKIRAHGPSIQLDFGQQIGLSAFAT